MAATKLKIQIYPDASNQWRWRYVRGSKITGVSGESFSSHGKAYRAVCAFHKAIGGFDPHLVYEMQSADIALRNNVQKFIYTYGT